MFKLESTYDYRNLMMYEDRVADIYWSQILKTVNKLCPEPYLYYYTSISAKERGYSFDTGIDSSKINTKLKIKVTKQLTIISKISKVFSYFVKNHSI